MDFKFLLLIAQKLIVIRINWLDGLIYIPDEILFNQVLSWLYALAPKVPISGKRRVNIDFWKEVNALQAFQDQGLGLLR